MLVWDCERQILNGTTVTLRFRIKRKRKTQGFVFSISLYQGQNSRAFSILRESDRSDRVSTDREIGGDPNGRDCAIFFQFIYSFLLQTGLSSIMLKDEAHSLPLAIDCEQA